MARERKRLADANAWRRPTGWSSLAVGAVMVGAGGWLLAQVVDDQGQLDAKVSQRNAGGQVVGIDATTYNSEQDRLDRNTVVSGALLGVGVVAAGVGGWLLWRRPAAASVTLLPRLDGRGARLLVRF